MSINMNELGDAAQEPAILTALFTSHDSAGGFTVYTISVQSSAGDSWTVCKRYREISAMYKDLRQIHRELIAQMPPMPPKTFFRCGILKEDFIETRSAGLQNFVNGVIRLELQQRNELSLKLWHFLHPAQQLEAMKAAWEQVVQAATDQVLVANAGAGVDGLYDLEKWSVSQMVAVPRFASGGYRRHDKKPVHLVWKVRAMRWAFCEMPDPQSATEEDDAGKCWLLGEPVKLGSQPHQAKQWIAFARDRWEPRPAVLILPIIPGSKCSVSVTMSPGDKVISMEMSPTATLCELKHHIEGEWQVPVLFQKLVSQNGTTSPKDLDMIGAVGAGGSVELRCSQEVMDGRTKVEISGAHGTCCSLINGTYSWADSAFHHERVDNMKLCFTKEPDGTGCWCVVDNLDPDHVLLRSSVLPGIVCPTNVTEWTEWASNKKYDQLGISFAPGLMMEQEGKWSPCPGLKLEMKKGRDHRGEASGKADNKKDQAKEDRQAKATERDNASSDDEID